MRHSIFRAGPATLTILAGSLWTGCTGSPVPPPPPMVAAGDDAFDAAVARARVSDDDGAMAALRLALEGEPGACQRALLEPAFSSGLRDTAEFRAAVHEAAVRHRIGHLALAPADEPGEWIEIEGRVVDPANAPVPGAVVKVYATDVNGLYHPGIEGDRVPRLFASLVADDEGRFGFGTVRPGPYPGTRDARHVHISARAGQMRLAAPHYAVFDDDPLLFEPQNAEQRGEAIRIAMKVVDGKARGTIVLPMR